MTKTVGMTELGRHFSKSMPTIRNWIAKGMPVVTHADRDKGINWEFDLQDVIDWHDDWMAQRQEEAETKREANQLSEYEHEDIIAARKKKIEVETERLQLRLEQERGELVPIDAITQVVERQFGSVKAHLLALPDKVAPLLVSRNSAKEINEVLRSYIIEALEELQQDTIEHEPENEADDQF